MGEASLLGLDFIYKTLEKVHIIRNRLQMNYSQHKSYADRRRDLEFEKCDKVYSKISPLKGVVRFCMKGKLSPLYVGSYEILKRVCKVYYELELPNESSGFPCFHVEEVYR